MRRTGYFSSKSDVCKKRAVQVVFVLICNRVACDFLLVLRCSTPPLPPACVFVCMGRVSCTRIAFRWDQKSCLNLKLNESETLAEACCIAPGDKQIFSLLYCISFGYLRGTGELSHHIFEQLTIVFTGVSLHAYIHPMLTHSIGH